MSFTRMHNEYLDPDRYFEEDYFSGVEEALRKMSTGRWENERLTCCLSGKDADLGAGKVAVELLTVDDDQATFRVHLYLTIAGTDVCLHGEYGSCREYSDALENYLDEAQEIVIGSSLEGEWDGDSWYLKGDEWGKVGVVYSDDQSENDDEKTAEAICAQAWKTAKPILDEFALVNEAIRRAAGYPEKTVTKGEL